MSTRNDNVRVSKLAVAPMMDWTDRHCRYFMRLLSPSVRLYTEMVTSNAIHFGDADTLLRFHPAEHPIAVQLGGSDPALMAEAALRAASAGYDEININVGCPSDRVQSGRFGACLMDRPAASATGRKTHSSIDSSTPWPMPAAGASSCTRGSPY